MAAQPTEPRPDPDGEPSPAEAAALLAEYQQWVEQGRPRGRPHDEVMRDLLGDAW